MEFKMDLLVIGFQEARNSSKRVRRNGEGKNVLLCNNRFLTRHCALRTVNYGESYFLKPLQQSFSLLRARGARGRRDSLLQDVDAPQPEPAAAARRQQGLTQRRRETEERESQDTITNTKTESREGREARAGLDTRNKNRR